MRIGGSEGGAFTSGPPLLNRRLVTCDMRLIGDAWHSEMPRRGLLTAQLIRETSSDNRPLQSLHLPENWPEALLTLDRPTHILVVRGALIFARRIFGTEITSVMR